MTEIDWATLKDRTGKAAGVGQALDKLRSADREQRRVGLSALEQSLYLQKQWFSAGAAAIPVLGAIASSSESTERHQLLALITNVVTSDHRGLVTTGYDREDEKLKPDLSQKGAIAALAAATREAPRWQGFLSDPDPRVRTAAAFLLAFLPDSASTSIPLLEDRLSREEEPFARSSLLLSLGILGMRAEQKTRDRIGAKAGAISVAPQEPALVRGVAAVSRLYFDRSALPVSLDPLLVELLLMGDLGSERWPWIFGRVDALVSRLLIDRADDGRRSASLLTEALLSTQGQHALTAEWYKAIDELTLGADRDIPMPSELSPFQRLILVRLADLPQTASSLRDVPHHPMDFRCWLGLEPPGTLEQEVDFSLAGQSGQGPLWKLLFKFSRKPFGEAIEVLAQALAPATLLSALIESQFRRYNFSIGNIGQVANFAAGHADCDWAIATAKDVLRLRPELEPGSRFGAGNVLLARLPASLTGSGDYINEPWDRLVSVGMPRDLARRCVARLHPERRESALLRLLGYMVDDGDINQAFLPTLATLIDLVPSARVVQSTLDMIEILLRWGSIDDQAAEVFPTIWQHLEAMAASDPAIRSVLDGWLLPPEKRARLENAKQGATRLDP